MTERTFPILRDYRERCARPDARRSVPWAWVAPHEEQARSNHSQSLERLAQRGGLGPDELYLAVHGQPLRRLWREKFPTVEQAEAWLAGWDGTAPAAPTEMFA